jgi:hypothetical protein
VLSVAQWLAEAATGQGGYRYTGARPPCTPIRDILQTPSAMLRAPYKTNRRG